MRVTTDDQSDANELALAHAISELKRQQHNMKIAQRKKAEQDALFAVEQAAYREDIEEGSLGGYAAEVWRKERLLQLENSPVVTPRLQLD